MLRVPAAKYANQVNRRFAAGQSSSINHAIDICEEQVRLKRSSITTSMVGLHWQEHPAHYRWLSPDVVEQPLARDGEVGPTWQ